MINELDDHIWWIITEKKKHSIPDEQLPNVPKQIKLPVLGMQTEEVLELDRILLANEDAFKKKVQKLRNESGSKREGKYKIIDAAIRATGDKWFDECADWCIAWI